MLTDIIIKPAAAEDYSSVCVLLETEHLPVSDIRKDMHHFFIAQYGNNSIATIGLDPFGNAGLLRSMIVLPAYRKTGIAGSLIDTLSQHAKFLGISTLYLITNTAEAYFTKKGFEKISREDLPHTVAGSAEFNGLCPASSSIMKKQLQ